MATVMNEIAHEIRKTVDQARGSLARMTADEVSSKDRPDKWSRKEILGHLIDSAANNHQRFVRAAYNAASSFPTYTQNEWVRIQHYNESEWQTLVDLWSAYNRHLSHIIERLPEDAMPSPCNIGKEAPATLEVVVQDYLRHLRHHVDQLLAGR
jgi:hypothetical protein